MFSTVVGCSNGETSKDEVAKDQANSTSGEGTGFVEETKGESGAVEESGEEAGSDDAGSGSSTEATPSSDRMVIYNGNMVIAVEDFNEAQTQIENHIEQMGGYIAESSVQKESDDERHGSLSVRIPQENFTPFLNELESTSTEVLERSTNGNDVTEEYTDLESRLRSKETEEERLLSFMEDAENTEELLQISEDLSSIQEEIEQLTGRMNYLENHVAYSTVDIQIQEKAVSSLQDQESLHIWGSAKNLFTDTLNVILSFFSGLAVFVIGLSPVLIPLLIIITAVVIFLKKKRKNLNKQE